MAQPESTLILLPEIVGSNRNPCTQCHYYDYNGQCQTPITVCCVEDADTTRYSVALMEYSDVQA
jgi:hypothetical protein